MRHLCRELRLQLGDQSDQDVVIPTSRDHLTELKRRYVESGRDPMALLDLRRHNPGAEAKPIAEDVMAVINGHLATHNGNVKLAHEHAMAIARRDDDDKDENQDMFRESDVPSYHTVWRAIRRLPVCDRPQNCRSIGEFYEKNTCSADKSKVASNEQWHVDECEFKLYDYATQEYVSIFVTAVVDYHSFVIRAITATRKPLTGRDLMRALKKAFRRNPAIDMPRDALPHLIVMDGPKRHRGPGIAYMQEHLQTATGRKIRVIHYRELPKANATAEVMMKKIKRQFAQGFKAFFAGIGLFDMKHDFVIDASGIERGLQQFAKWHNNEPMSVTGPSVSRLVEYDRKSAPESWRVSRKDIDKYVLCFTDEVKFENKGIKLDGVYFGTDQVTKYGQTIRAAYDPEGGFDTAEGFLADGKTIEHFGQLVPMDTDRARRNLNKARRKVAERNVKRYGKERDSYLYMFAEGLSPRDYDKNNRDFAPKVSKSPRRKRKPSTARTSTKVTPTPKKRTTPKPKSNPSDFVFTTKSVQKQVKK